MFGPLLSLDESFRCSSSVSLVVDHRSPCWFVPCPLSRQAEIPHCGESHSSLSHVLRNAGCQRLSWAPWPASGVLGQVDVHGFAGGRVGGHSQDVSCHSPPRCLIRVDTGHVSQRSYRRSLLTLSCSLIPRMHRSCFLWSTSTLERFPDVNPHASKLYRRLGTTSYAIMSTKATSY